MHREKDDREKICDRNGEFETLCYILSQSRRFQVCELIPTPKCKMSPCPVEATFVGGEVIIIVIVIVIVVGIFSFHNLFAEHYEESFEPWECELRPKILYHHK